MVAEEACALLSIVRVARKLDMLVQGEFMLIVRATDRGTTPR